jgi:UDP-glucose 4-epimerase
VRYLITGGLGFIGSHVVNQLSEVHDNNVLVIDNAFTGKRDFLTDKGNVSVKDIDITDENLLLLAFREFNPDIVIHLAAIAFIPLCEKNKELAYEVNVKGTYNIVKACREIKPRSFFFASSGAVYKPDTRAHNEREMLWPVDTYGFTKLLGEKLVSDLTAEGIRCTIGRFFNVYGSNYTNPYIIPTIINQIDESGDELWVGDTSPSRDFIHVHDLSNAILELLRPQIPDGIYNIGTGVSTTISELIDIIQSLRGYSLHIKLDPGKVRPVDRPLLLANITKIKDVTGWRPAISLLSGIEKLINKHPVI